MSVVVGRDDDDDGQHDEQSLRPVDGTAALRRPAGRLRVSLTRGGRARRTVLPGNANVKFETGKRTIEQTQGEGSKGSRVDFDFDGLLMVSRFCIFVRIRFRRAGRVDFRLPLLFLYCVETSCVLNDASNNVPVLMTVVDNFSRRFRFFCDNHNKTLI